MENRSFVVSEIKFENPKDDSEVNGVLGKTLARWSSNSLESAKSILNTLLVKYERDGWRIRNYQPPEPPLFVGDRTGQFGAFVAEKEDKDYHVFVCIETTEHLDYTCMIYDLTFGVYMRTVILRI